MSFSVDLWNGFNIIKEEISINQKNLKDVLDILTLYYNMKNKYYKDLEDLCKITNEKRDKIPNSFINNAVDTFILSFMKESEIYKKNIDNINKNINDTKKEYDKINLQIFNYFNENDQNKESFNKILDHLKLKQDRYNSSCDELCKYIAEMEAFKIMGDNTNYDENQYIERKNDLIKKTNDIKIEYIDIIEESEKEREKYNKITEDLLNNLQNRFKDIIFLLHNKIDNYIKDKINFYNEIITINKQKDEELFSTINYKKETNNFIIKNTTKIINQKEINQILNKFNELSKENKTKINDSIKNIFNKKNLNINEKEFINIISGKGKSSIKTINKRESFIKSNFTFINDFVFKLCNSNELNIESRQNIQEESYMYNDLLFRFMDLISINNKEHFEYLKVFIKLLSYYRSKAFFILKENSYKIFINIFSFILLNYKNSDNLIKNIILLAQTFYQIDKNTNKKIY